MARMAKSSIVKHENMSIWPISDRGSEVTPDMFQEAKDIALKAVEELGDNMDLASMAKYIKKAFDEKYSRTWHCIVGTHFASFVSHEVPYFMFFYCGSIAILLFRAG